MKAALADLDQMARTLPRDRQPLVMQLRRELAEGTPEFAFARVLREVADGLTAEPIRVRVVGYEQ